jgi:mismatch-specific thymine-DNA glycosylase
VLAPGLDIVFVGFNPGKLSAQRAHHFAGPNNHFWRLLAGAGITPRLFSFMEDTDLPKYGLGVTNIVGRPSRSSSDLSLDELRAGGDELAVKLAVVRPRIVCLLGKDVYRAYVGLSSGREVKWGEQAAARLPGSIDFVAPNPSSRSTIPFAERLTIMQALQALRERVCG